MNVDSHIHLLEEWLKQLQNAGTMLRKEKYIELALEELRQLMIAYEEEKKK